MPAFSTLLTLLLDATPDATPALPGTDSVSGLITTLSHEGPLVCLFLLITMYLVYQNHRKDKLLEKKDDEIKELTREVVDYGKEQEIILHEVSSTLDKVIDNQKNMNDTVIRELTSLRDLMMRFTFKGGS